MGYNSAGWVWHSAAMGPFSRLTWHLNNLTGVDPFSSAVFAWRPNWRFRIGPWPPGAQKRAKRALLGPPTWKTGQTGSKPTEFRSFYPLEFSGFVDKRPRSVVSPSGLWPFLAVLVGLVVRKCHFVVTACAEARRLDNALTIEDIDLVWWLYIGAFDNLIEILSEVILQLQYTELEVLRHLWYRSELQSHDRSYHIFQPWRRKLYVRIWVDKKRKWSLSIL